jgi:protein-tyrosine phosphatase
MGFVLFVCTGNYYRSRLAEAVFNHLAIARGLTVRAKSRGFSIHSVRVSTVQVQGELSKYTRTYLEQNGIDLLHTGSTRTQLTLEDLEDADRIIAMDEMEHRPMVVSSFPEWADKFEYWQFADLGRRSPPTLILPAIAARVTELISEYDSEPYTDMQPAP